MQRYNQNNNLSIIAPWSKRARHNKGWARLIACSAFKTFALSVHVNFTHEKCHNWNSSCSMCRALDLLYRPTCFLQGYLYTKPILSYTARLKSLTIKSKKYDEIMPPTRMLIYKGTWHSQYLKVYARRRPYLIITDAQFCKQILDSKYWNQY